MPTDQPNVTLTGVTSMATRTILADCAAAFAAETGIEAGFAAMGGVEAARKLGDGLRVDLAALAGGPIDALIAAGRLVAGTRIDYAVSAIAVAVPAGAERPRIDTVEALRAAAAAARRVAVSTGPSGDHVRRLLAGWDQDGADHLVVAPPGVPVAALLARGEADLGFQQASEMMGEPGIAILGPMPAAVALDTVFACALGVDAADPAAARRFLAYLVSPAAAQIIRRGGMEPLGAA